MFVAYQLMYLSIMIMYMYFCCYFTGYVTKKLRQYGNEYTVFEAMSVKESLGRMKCYLNTQAVAIFIKDIP